MAHEFLQDRTKRYLKDNGKMQKWLAAQVGVSQPMLSMWLRDKTSFDTRTIERIRIIVESGI